MKCPIFLPAGMRGLCAGKHERARRREHPALLPGKKEAKRTCPQCGGTKFRVKCSATVVDGIYANPILECCVCGANLVDMKEDGSQKPEPSCLPTKIMFVKLVDDNKRELCAGAYFSYDDPGVENFDEAEKACWSSLYENIRRKSLFHVNKTYTDKEIEAAISLLIDYAHYSIEWGYMGWAR